MNRIIILKNFRCQLLYPVVNVFDFPWKKWNIRLINIYLCTCFQTCSLCTFVRFVFQTSMNVSCIDPVRTGPRVTTVLGPTPVAVPLDGPAKTVIQVQHQWHHPHGTTTLNISDLLGINEVITNYKVLFIYGCILVEINECLVIRPCQNGAECVNTPGSYRCICPPGWTGTNCEIGMCKQTGFYADTNEIYLIDSFQ